MVEVSLFPEHIDFLLQPTQLTLQRFLALPFSLDNGLLALYNPLRPCSRQILPVDRPRLQRMALTELHLLVFNLDALHKKQLLLVALLDLHFLDLCAQLIDDHVLLVHLGLKLLEVNNLSPCLICQLALSLKRNLTIGLLIYQLLLQRCNLCSLLEDGSPVIFIELFSDDQLLVGVAGHVLESGDVRFKRGDGLFELARLHPVLLIFHLHLVLFQGQLVLRPLKFLFEPSMLELKLLALDE